MNVAQLAMREGFDMKKAYEKPVLTKRQKLGQVVAVTSKPV